MFGVPEALLLAQLCQSARALALALVHVAEWAWDRIAIYPFRIGGQPALGANFLPGQTGLIDHGFTTYNEVGNQCWCEY